MIIARFSHILGYALVKATQIHPDMNFRYEVKDGAINPDTMSKAQAFEEGKTTRVLFADDALKTTTKAPPLLVGGAPKTAGGGGGDLSG